MMGRWWAVAVAAVLMLLVGAVGVGYAVGVYNELIVLEQNVAEKWSQVQNVYQRRSDLIPNLVETVKGYAAHERGTLEAVTRARASATAITVTPETLKDPAALAAFRAAQEQLSGALSRLLVTLEKYPTLKADRGFRDLQAQLETTENRIAVERQRFNAAVFDYNARVRLFPGSVVAARAGYQPRAYFTATGADTAPGVSFK